MGDIKDKLVIKWRKLVFLKSIYSQDYRQHVVGLSPFTPIKCESPLEDMFKQCLRTLGERRLWRPLSGHERADVEWIEPPGGCFNDSCTVRRAALVGRGQRKCIIVIEILYKHRGKSPAGLLAVRVINYVSFPALIKSCEHTLLRV